MIGIVSSGVDPFEIDITPSEAPRKLRDVINDHVSRHFLIGSVRVAENRPHRGTHVLVDPAKVLVLCQRDVEGLQL